MQPEPVRPQTQMFERPQRRLKPILAKQNSVRIAPILNFSNDKWVQLEVSVKTYKVDVVSLEEQVLWIASKGAIPWTKILTIKLILKIWVTTRTWLMNKLLNLTISLTNLQRQYSWRTAQVTTKQLI